jgi:hypothetical protein
MQHGNIASQKTIQSIEIREKDTIAGIFGQKINDLFPPEHNHQQQNKYMQNQIVVHNQSVSDIETMAKAITKSGLFGIKSPDQAVALMLVAQSEGRHPASVASEFDIIQGRPALKSQAALARFQAAGGKIQWTSRGPTKCSAKFSHAQGGELEITWTMERANAAGLTGKATWKQYPDQMLSARVVAEGVRAVFPACLNGVYLAEEVADFDSRPRYAKEPETIVIEDSKQIAEPSKAEPIEARVELIDESNWWNAEVEKQIIEAGEDMVNDYLTFKGRIESGQTWKDIKDETYRSNLVAKTSKFIEAVLKAK